MQACALTHARVHFFAFCARLSAAMCRVLQAYHVHAWGSYLASDSCFDRAFDARLWYSSLASSWHLVPRGTDNIQLRLRPVHACMTLILTRVRRSWFEFTSSPLQCGLARTDSPESRETTLRATGLLLNKPYKTIARTPRPARDTATGAASGGVLKVRVRMETPPLTASGVQSLVAPSPLPPSAHTFPSLLPSPAPLPPSLLSLPSSLPP
jgi:hypothetical protein